MASLETNRRKCSYGNKMQAKSVFFTYQQKHTQWPKLNMPLSFFACNKWNDKTKWYWYI